MIFYKGVFIYNTSAKVCVPRRKVKLSSSISAWMRTSPSTDLDKIHHNDFQIIHNAVANSWSYLKAFECLRTIIALYVFRLSCYAVTAHGYV